MKTLPESLQQGRGPDWPFDVERLNPGDACEFRFPARSNWHKAVVIINGTGSYWTVKSLEDSEDTTNGEICSGLYIEYIRTPQPKESVTYIFATVRGEDFEIDGTSPTDAYRNLVNRERDNGTLWRLNDPYCNKARCKTHGFKTLDKDDYTFRGPVYKEKSK